MEPKNLIVTLKLNMEILTEKIIKFENHSEQSLATTLQNIDRKESENLDIKCVNKWEPLINVS